MTEATFPGGTSVSFLDVYDDVAPDGLRGGSPHVHLASTECYAVLSGRGRLQTIDRSGFRETTLEAGSVAWFTPGTVHRAVNDGDLRALVVMSNAGLPEAGDAVSRFPKTSSLPQPRTMRPSRCRMRWTAPVAWRPRVAAITPCAGSWLFGPRSRAVTADR